jgi:hypothetical protein
VFCCVRRQLMKSHAERNGDRGVELDVRSGQGDAFAAAIIGVRQRSALRCLAKL